MKPDLCADLLWDSWQIIYGALGSIAVFITPMASTYPSKHFFFTVLKKLKNFEEIRKDEIVIPFSVSPWLHSSKKTAQQFLLEPQDIFRCPKLGGVGSVCRGRSLESVARSACV